MSIGLVADDGADNRFLASADETAQSDHFALGDVEGALLEVASVETLDGKAALAERGPLAVFLIELVIALAADHQLVDVVLDEFVAGEFAGKAAVL
jgi:hypothetical protein